MLLDEVIRAAAELSQDVYQATPSAGVLIESENAAFIHRTDSAGRFYICFRGSNDKQDWLDNFSTSLFPFFSGYAHSGFVEHWDQLSELVEELALQNTDREIILCGHSLGGALAALAAIHLNRKGFSWDSLNVCTFGAPRALDVKLATSVRCVSLRVVNYGDPVPLAPLSIVPRWAGGKDCGRYQHHSSAAWFLMEDGTIRTERKSFLYRVFMAAWRWFSGDSLVSNHSMDEYVKRLRLTPIYREIRT